MSRPWVTLDVRETEDGRLELRRREQDDFLILVGGRVLMNSRESRSERVLGERACAELGASPRVLVGGLGMGMTLRAMLDVLSPEARVDVAELHPTVAEWCQGPLAELTDGAIDYPRVTLRIGDVADSIRMAAEDETRYDAIVLDLFEGPHARTDAVKDPLYGTRAIERTWRALAPKGVLGVWAEAPERGFERRLRHQGFRVDGLRPGRGGYRHWVVLAHRPGRA